MSRPTDEPDLTALETMLATLAPAPTDLDRAVLLYRAGQASVRRNWAWPCAAMVSTLAVLGLALVLLFRPAEERIVVVPGPERIVQVPMPPEPNASQTVSNPNSFPETPDTPRLPGRNYLTLRQEVTRWGMAALPELPDEPVIHKPLSRDKLLDLPPEAFKDPWFRSHEASLESGGDL